MTIERHNIFDLIGNDQRRFEHAIITTFSFDYSFFEHRVLRALRSANIRNINVLADAGYLDQALEKTTEDTFLQPRTYSLIPVTVSGVFHPKIMLLAGPKQGLLVIGSGNLTASGIGTNDEIWGAFHLSDIESPHAPVFSAVWQYLRQYAAQSLGYHAHKWGWISQKATWIEKLPAPPATGFIDLDDLLSVAFIANDRDGSTLEKLKSLVPAGTVRRLTVLSPYFDENGDALTLLNNSFDIQEFRCITDVEYGLLPYAMDQKAQQNIAFIDWQHCIKGFDRKYNRLHAKLFHFDMADGSEYLLFGSANATLRGLGTSTGYTANAEAGILLRRQKGGNYLKDLGLEVDISKAFQVGGRQPRFAGQGDALSSTAYQNRILTAQHIGNNLTILCKKPVDKKIRIGVLTHPLAEPNVYDIPSEDKEFTIVLDQMIKPNIAALYTAEKRISPFAHIDDIHLLSKTNPDARQAAIDTVIESIMANPDADGYAELLRYQEYNWLDDDLDQEKRVKNLSFGSTAFAARKEQHYESIDEAAFNQLNSVQLIEATWMSSPSAQIADFLNLISQGLAATSNISESSEQLLSQEKDTEGEGRGEDSVRVRSGLGNGEKDAQAFNHHFGLLHKRFGERLKALEKTAKLEKSPTEPITMKEMNNLSAALDILIIFQGKKYEKQYTRFALNHENKYQEQLVKLLNKYPCRRSEYYDKNKPGYVFYEVESAFYKLIYKEFGEAGSGDFLSEKNLMTVYEYQDYIPNNSLNGESINGIKWNLLDVLGSFLFAANPKAGYKQYGDPAAMAREQELRWLVFHKSVFLLLNLYWSDKDVIYRNIMLLDLLHNVCSKVMGPIDISRLQESVLNYYSRSHKKYSNFETNLSWFVNRIVPQYQQWRVCFDSSDRSTIQKPFVNLENGQTVYHSRIGFASVYRKGTSYLELQKAGFKIDTDRKAPIQKIEFPVQTITVYSEK